MEIISYVGNHSGSSVREKNYFTRCFVYFNHVFTKSKSVKRNISYSFASKTKSDFSVLLFLKKLGDFLWFLPCAVAIFLLPLGIAKTFSYVQNHVNPLHLELNGTSELENLDKLMASFALDTSMDYDSDGNLISEENVKADSVRFHEIVKFTTYKVLPGDTISGISRKFGLKNISTLIAVNNISNVRQVYSGQKLKIPSVDGLVYKVQSGNTLQGLSAKYGIALEDILDVNDLDTMNLTTGQELFIPGAKLDRESIQKAMGELFSRPLATKWRQSCGYGWRADPFTGVRQFHNGLDLAVAHGTPVLSVLSGKVLVSGWSNLYGNYIIIGHANGYQTLYGHLSKRLVKKGDVVNQQTQIGLVGSTGYSTGPHLHFTVYKNSKAVDPSSLIR